MDWRPPCQTYSSRIVDYGEDILDVDGSLRYEGAERCYASSDGSRVFQFVNHKEDNCSTVKVLDTSTSSIIHEGNGPILDPHSIAFSPDGLFVAGSSSGDNTAHVWKLATGRPVWKSLHGLQSFVKRAVCFMRDSSELAANDMDGNFLAWFLIILLTVVLTKTILRMHDLS